MAVENFTTYEEEDPNEHIDLVGTNHIDFDSWRNENAYLYKDKGAGHFTDFEHKVDFYMTTGEGGWQTAIVYSVGNAEGTFVNQGNRIGIGLWKRDVEGNYRIYLFTEAGTQDYVSEADGVAKNTWYYGTIKRDGTSLTLKVYEEAARTTLLWTLTGTVVSGYTYRYIYGCAVYNNDGNEIYNRVKIENLDLQEGVAHYQTIEESLGMVDSVARAKGAKQTVTESLGLLDQVTKRADFKKAVPEVLGMVDSVKAPGTLHLTVTEKLGLVDSVAKAKSLYQTVMESLGLADVISKRADLKQVVAEKLGLVDVAARRKGVKQVVMEALGLVDSTVPRVLISKIPDQPDHTGRGGAPEFLDLPDNVEALYASVKNTWQDAENLDGTHGYITYIWIPEETFKVQIMKLRAYAEKFRAHSKGSEVVLPKHTHYVSGQTAQAGGDHLHILNYVDADRTTGSCTLTVSQMPSHRHYGVGVDGYYSEYTGGGEGHTHSYKDMRVTGTQKSGDHTHTITGVTSEEGGGSHSHAIVFGIYEEDITGRTLSGALYDPDGNLAKDFGVIQTGEGTVLLDLSEYFETLKYGMWELRLTASGRLRARLIFYELCLMYAY